MAITVLAVGLFLSSCASDHLESVPSAPAATVTVTADPTPDPIPEPSNTDATEDDGSAVAGMTAQDPSEGSDRSEQTDGPSPQQSEAPEVPEASGAPSEVGARDGEHTFGSTVIFDGIEITLSAPSDLTPSGVSLGGEDFAAHRKWTVTLTNLREEPYEQSLFYTNAQSGSTEADEVFDARNDLLGPPAIVLLPGRTSTFDIGYGLEDPADVVMEVSVEFMDNGVFFVE